MKEMMEEDHAAKQAHWLEQRALSGFMLLCVDRWRLCNGWQ